MKIRSGFVSNSSSSSFLIYGISIAKDKLAEFFPDQEDFDKYGFFDDKLEGTCLEEHSQYDSSYFNVGCSWDSVRDDETGRDFKIRVEIELEKVFGKKMECGTIEDAWFDG